MKSTMKLFIAIEVSEELPPENVVVKTISDDDTAIAYAYYKNKTWYWKEWGQEEEIESLEPDYWLKEINVTDTLTELLNVTEVEIKELLLMDTETSNWDEWSDKTAKAIIELLNNKQNV